MAEQTVDEVISAKAFEQVDRMVKDLTTLEDKIAGFSKASRSAEFDVKGAKSLNDFATAAGRAGEEVKGLSESTEEYISYNIAAQQALKVWGGTLTQNATQLVQQKVRLSAVNAEIKAYEKSQLAGVAASDAYKKKISELIVEQGQLKVTTGQLTLNIKQQAKEQVAAGGSTEQLRARLVQLNSAYDNLSIDIKNGKVGTTLKSEIDKVSAAVTQAEQSTGRFSRNVGNYNAVTQQFGFILGEIPNAGISFRTFIQSISNNVVGFGNAVKDARGQGQSWKQILGELGKSLFSVQGLIIAATLAITYFASTITKGSSAAGMAEQANKKYADSLKSIEDNAYGSAAKEIAHIKALLAVATSTDTANVSTKNRLRAVDELQKTYPDYFGKLSKESILMNDVADATKEATKAILAKAMAQAYEDKIAAATKKKVELIDAERKAQKELNDETRRTKNLQLRGTANSDEKEAKGIDQFFSQTKVTEAKKNIVDIGKEIAAVDEELNQFGLDLANSAKGAGQLMFGNDPKGPKSPKGTDLTNETLKAENNLTETLSDINKARFQLEAEKNKDIYENEQETFEKRLAALYLYGSFKQQEIELEKQKELDIVQNTLDEITTIEGISESKRTNEQKKLLLKKEDLEAKKSEIEARYLYLSEKQVIATENKKYELQKQGHEKLKAYLVGNISELANVRSAAEVDERAALMDSLNGEKIDFEQYQQGLGAIERKYTIQRLTLAQEAIGKLLDEAKKDAAFSQDEIKELTRLYGEYSEQVVKAKEAIASFNAGQQEDIKNLKLQLGAELLNTFQNIIDANFEKRVQQHETIIQQIEDEKNAEIDKINASALTDIEKKKEILKINAEAHAETIAQQDEIRRVKRRQALADRAINVAEVTGKTAIAVMEALAIPIYGEIKAAFIGALGALQIASILAAPIPEYAMGTDFHPGGLAKVGDGGQPEWVQEGNKGWWSPATDTIVDLARGASVTPLSDIMASQIGMLSPALLASLGVQKQQQDNNTVLAQKLDEVKSAISNKQENTWVFQNGDLKQIVRRGNDRIEYLGKNIFD